MSDDIKNSIHYYIVDSDNPKEAFDELFYWFMDVHRRYISNDRSIPVKEVKE